MNLFGNWFFFLSSVDDNFYYFERLALESGLIVLSDHLFRQKEITGNREKFPPKWHKPRS